MPTIVLYFNWRDVSLAEVFKLISFFSFCIVLFEYPTGVVGDYFSHKISVLLGYFVSATALLLASFDLNITYYIAILALLAFGTSLCSGSDTALLHKVSTDFKKDFASIKTYIMLWVVTTVSLGGFLGKISLVLTIYFSVFSYFLAFLVMLTVKTTNNVSEDVGNIFDKAKDGIRYIRKNPLLKRIILLNTLVSSVFLSIKWIYNQFFENLNIDLQWWGVLISLATAFNILGVFTFKKSKNVQVYLPYILLIVTFFLIPLFLSFFYIVPLVLFLITHFLGAGFIETYFEVDINKNLVDSSRASVLSFNSLVIRLVSSIYTFTLGVLVGTYPIQVIFIFTALMWSVLGIPFLIQYTRRKVN